MHFAARTPVDRCLRALIRRDEADNLLVLDIQIINAATVGTSL